MVDFGYCTSERQKNSDSAYNSNIYDLLWWNARGVGVSPFEMDGEESERNGIKTQMASFHPS